jgi:hypothetical protein
LKRLSIFSPADKESSIKDTSAPLVFVSSNVRDQRRRTVGAPLAEVVVERPLAVSASGVTTNAERCIA